MFSVFYTAPWALGFGRYQYSHFIEEERKQEASVPCPSHTSGMSWSRASQPSSPDSAASAPLGSHGSLLPTERGRIGSGMELWGRLPRGGSL